MVGQVLARAQGPRWRWCPWWRTGFQGPQLVCLAGQPPPPRVHSGFARPGVSGRGGHLALASALESRRDLMSSLRQGQIPAARPPVWLKRGALFLDEGLVVAGEKGQQVSRQAEMALFLVSGDGNRSASMIMVLMDRPISRLRLTIVGCWQTESRWRRDSWCGGDGAGHKCGEMLSGWIAAHQRLVSKEPLRIRRRIFSRFRVGVRLLPRPFFMSGGKVGWHSTSRSWLGGGCEWLWASAVLEAWPRQIFRYFWKNLYREWKRGISLRLRSYSGGHRASRPLCERKPQQALVVLTSETSREGRVL